VKIFGLSILTGVGGYAVGLAVGVVLINLLSSNRYDKSMEAAMTGAFVTGPAIALISFIAMLVYLLMRKAG
jgi:hypothetical protein